MRTPVSVPSVKSSAETMEQQVRERFEAMRLALEKEEQAVLGSLEQEHREISSRMARLVHDWNQHLKLVRKHISAVRTLQERGTASQQQVCLSDINTDIHLSIKLKLYSQDLTFCTDFRSPLKISGKSLSTYSL